MQPITFAELLSAGATDFGWIHPDEDFSKPSEPSSMEEVSRGGSTISLDAAFEDEEEADETWRPTSRGGFVYLRDGQPPIYFEMQPRPPLRVAYLTDVEGNWEYFLSCVEMSEGLQMVGLLADGSANIELKDGWRLVYGGDVVDKGGLVGGSVRVTTSLVVLKERYSERVTLILGNRDLNKMRITSELADEQLLNERLAGIPGPYWVPETKQVSPRQYLAKLLAKDGNSDPTDEEVAAINTPINRLRWMLTETMGAADEDERRRAELSKLRMGAEVSDDEVVSSLPHMTVSRKSRA